MFGDIITDARSDFNAQSGGHPYISMTMTGEAATNWAKLTKANSCLRKVLLKKVIQLR